MARNNDDYDYEPSTYPWNILVFVTSFITIFISFFSPYWLQNDYTLEKPPFSNTGLWQICFNEYKDFKYMYDRVYDGCYWTLDEEMHVRSDQLYAPFFVTVQVFFTFCFTFALIGLALVGSLVLCPGEDFEPYILKATYIDCFVGWAFGFIAVIVFGAMGDNRDWMPHWEHNNLSWSFALVWYEPTDTNKASKPWKCGSSAIPSFISPNLNEFNALIEYITAGKHENIDLTRKDFPRAILSASLHFNWTSMISAMVTFGPRGFMIIRSSHGQLSPNDPLLPHKIRISDEPEKHLIGLLFSTEPIKEVVSVSGAGDCLASGFISGMLRRSTISECAALGVKCALESLQYAETIPQSIESVPISILKEQPYEIITLKES